MAENPTPPSQPRNFNVGIQGILDTNRGVNFNIQVTAPDVVSALDEAKKELSTLLSNSGLGVLAPSASPVVVPIPVNPNAPAL